MSTCVYKECYPPTGVTLCEAAYFTHAPLLASSGGGRNGVAAAAGSALPLSQQALKADAAASQAPQPVLPNLVVVRTNRLEVYRVRSSAAPAATQPAASSAPGAAPGAGCGIGGVGGARLELVHSSHLHGVVESMAVLSGGSPGRRDALLLAFRDAKLSVVEWDPRAHTLRTSSLHYFEGEGEGAALRAAAQGGRCEGLGGRSSVPLPPRVVADPAGRCAAVAVLFNQLALLPALESDALDLGGLGCGVASVGNSYMLNLQKMMGVREVRDCVFLHGYTEPVLLVLHEPDPTWAGRLRERKDTCCLTAISISLRLKRHTLLWKVAGLPYDSYKLLAVPYRPAVLVISPNLIILSSQASQHAAALNSNALPGEAPPPLTFDPACEHPATTAARMAAEFALNVHPDCAPSAGRSAAFMADLEAVAGGAAAAWLTPTTCIMGLQSGSLLAVHLRFEGPPEQRITAVRTGGGPVATAMVGLTMAAVARSPAAAAAALGGAAAAAVQPYHSYRGPKGLVFLGSWTGDSVLMQLRPRAAAAAEAGAEADGARDAKRPKRRQEADADGGDGEGDGAGAAATNRSAAVAAAAAAFAAAAAAADAAGCALRYNLRLLDALPSIGPVRDLLFADTSVSSYCSGAGGSEASRGGPTTFLCVGQGATGGIVLARQGVLPDVVTEVGLAAIGGVFSVHHRTEDDDTAELLAELPPRQGAGAAEAGGDAEDADGGGEERADAMEMTPEPPEVGEGGGAGVKKEEAAAEGEPGPAAEVRVKEEEAGPADGVQPGDEPTSPPEGGAAGVKRAHSPPPAPKQSPEDPAAAGPPAAADGAIVPAAARPGAVPAPSRPTGPPYHAYLLLSLGRSRSMVLQCAEGLDDVTGTPGCDFITDQPTIGAGNLFHNATIVQACPGCVRLLEGMTLVQELPVAELQALGPPALSRQAGTSSPTITFMQCCDPYVLVLLSSGSGLLLEGDPLSLTLGLAAQAAEQTLAAPARSHQLRLAACCLQRDESGWMTATLGSGVDGGRDGGDGGGGEDGSAGAGAGGAVYLWLCRRSGRLECYSLPAMRLVFQSAGLAGGEEVLRMGPTAMYDINDLFGGGEADGFGGGEGGGSVVMEDPVAELRVEAFAGGGAGSAATPGVPDCERPVLLALTASGSLLAYQAFNPAAAGPDGPLLQHRLAGEGLAAAVAAAAHGSASSGPGLALRRLDLDSLSHEAPAALQAAAGGTALGPRLVRFDHLAASDPLQKGAGPRYSGVFVCGSRPLWLVASRGGLVAHPMFVEGPVASLAPFHNANCPLGFITACSARGQLKVCQLPPHTRLDGPWVSRRVALRVTPHRLAWFRDAGLLAALTSRSVPTRPRPPEEPGGDPHAAAAYAAAAAAAAGRGREEAWELRLLEPAGCSKLWVSAPLPAGEQALCLRFVYLRNAATGDTDALLAVGTGFPLGEDHPCLGRILLYSVGAEVVDLGAGNLTRRWNATLVATRDMASAVTSVQEFKSQLLVSCGSRVEMYEWRGGAAGSAPGGPLAGSLDKRAFFDLPCLVTGLTAVKDYLLASDAAHGLYFVRYSDAARVLEFMSKDFDPRDVLASGVLISEPKLAFLAADAAGNLALSEFYGTRNTNPEFWAGQRLAPLGLLHVARRVSATASLKMATADGKNRAALLCGSAEGGLSYVAPVAEAEAAARLAALQAHMSRSLSHAAGLNPRAFRHRFCRIPKPLGGGQSHHAYPPPPSAARPAGLLDGQLLLSFPHLPRSQQAEAAAAVGTSVTQLLADLRAIIAAATFG